MAAGKARRNVQVAAVEVQIAATKCRSCDLENTIGIGLQLRIRLVFHRNLMGALVDDGSHRSGWLERRHLWSVELWECVVVVVVTGIVDLYPGFDLFKAGPTQFQSSDSRSCGTDNGVEICVLESLLLRGMTG